MIIILLMLSVIIQDRLREFNSSFEGLLVDKYYERVRGWRGASSRDYYFKFSKDGREFIRQVDLEQYGVARIGNMVRIRGLKSPISTTSYCSKSTCLINTLPPLLNLK